MKKYDLTFPQRNIWMVENFYDSQLINIISGSFVIKRDFDVAKAEQMVNKFVELNEGMRLRIEVDNNIPKQYVVPFMPFDADKKDIQGMSEEEIERFKDEYIAKPIDMIGGPLFSYLLLDRGNGLGEVFVKVHHIIGDAWTISKMGTAFSEIYEKILNGEEYTETFPSYIDFIEAEQEYLASDKYTKDNEFWKEYLEGAASPLGLKDSGIIKDTGAKRHTIVLDEKYQMMLDEYCKANRVSPYTVFLSALAIYVERVTEKTDFVIGTPVLNRSNFKEKNMSGMFISTMPVRFKIDENETFVDFVKRTGTESLTLFRHQKYPYLKMSEIYKNLTSVNDNMYKLMLSYQNARASVAVTDKYELRWRFSGHIQDELEIHISDLNDTGRLEVHFDYLTSLFEDVEIEYLTKRILALIEDGITNNSKIETIKIMSDEEKHKILNEFNNTARPYPKDKTIIELFEEQVELNPNKVALVFENNEMTYSELNIKANKLAWYLKDKGVKENDFIAITIDKSFELMIAILAVLKVGACYVPIDVDYSLERKQYIAKDANCKYNLTVSNYENYIEYINLKEIDLTAYNNSNLERAKTYTWDSLVYVMYTSGTTGKPKGAMITNRNIVRLIKNTNYITFEPNDRIIQTGATVFDASTLEYWGALLNGISLYLINKNDLLNPIVLEEYLKENKISVMFITTALFNQMIEYNAKIFNTLRVLLTGGEVMSLKHINIAIENNINTSISNIYGPTENTTFSTYCELTKTQRKKVPIGKPISNTTAYILDSKNRVLPLYTEGELCLGGDGVGKGYLNNNELTSKVFVNNPLGEGVLYKCGDICSFLEDGNIDFVGRRDNQVKINGYRIELEEITNTLLKLDNIKEVVTVISEKNGAKHINLYYVSKTKCTDKDVINYLKETLPIYMIPAGIMRLDKMPLNQNGKVDRKNLPEIIIKQKAEKMNKTEKIVSDIIKEELQIVPTLHSNLFDIGLDSLSVIRLVTLLQNKFETNITTRDVMKLATIHDIAEYIDKDKESVRSISSSKDINITAAQNSIFMAYMKDTETTLYNIPFELCISNKIDVEKLVTSIEKVINNHQTFFIKFNVVNSKILEEIEKRDFNIEVRYVTNEEYLIEKEKFVKPFDLLEDILFRIKVFVVDSKINVLCDFHHSIFDGYSLQLFLNEIQDAYNNEELIAEKNTYLEYVKETNVLDDDVKYFKTMFAEEVQVTDMPYDRPRKKYMDYEGKKLKYELSKEVYDRIKKYVEDNKFTINSLMQSIYAITLAKYTYSDDVTIGISDANRVSAKYSNTVGMFVKTLPYREIIDWKKSINDFIKETQKKIIDVYAHNTCAYEDLLKHINVNRMPNRTPLFDTLFICQNKVDNIKFGAEQAVINEIGRPNSKFDITFEVVPSDDDMYITIEYKTTLYNEGTINRFVNNYLNVLNYILDNPMSALYDIEMISKEEKDIIVNKFNDTKTDYPKHKAIHQVFEETVETHKEKTAVVFEDKHFTYEELNKRANRLARYLLTKDVKKGDVIGIMIDKSIEYMVAVLGTLKAGLVYMPIAMDVPEERLKYLISNADVTTVITTNEFDRKLENVTKIHIDYVENNNDYIDIKDDTNLKLDICGDDKAYVLYTSGTTGVPKGIAIPHKGITRLLLNTNLVSYTDKETMLVSGSTTFDTSGFEIWGAMFYGMTLHLMRKKDILTPKYYEKYLRDNNITTTLIPTPIFNQFAEYNSKMFERLNTLYVCGDVLLPKYANAVIKTCQNTQLINTYGPTENSVICSKFVVDKEYENDISIGEPISNATCYVVDKCEKLCPIGVPGDLYTGGDGLAFGYVNREELTKEKFVTLKTINEPIYKTGDLTSYGMDGNIKFMGRIDTQIKLRGQRIEILEIQNKILDCTGVKECIVLLKGDDANKFLAAYYTDDGSVLEKDIIDYLNKYLPSYMVPSKFVRLDKMPLNQNGKIDRHALPEIEVKKANVVLPKNKKEEIILDCYKNVLDKDDIGMNDDFFEVGGDSLLAMTLVGKLEANSINIKYGDVFRYTTPKSMYQYVFNHIRKIDILDNKIAEYDYTNINRLLASKIDGKKCDIKNVLLTGATGYLGVHILSELLDNSKVSKIYCIVRDKNGKKAKDRLKDKINYYFGNKYDNIIQKKIIIITNNITDLDKIDPVVLNEITENVECVINSVAYVKHFGKKEIFEEVNVLAVNKLIEFCVKNNKKLIHISTISVSGNVIEGGRTIKSNVKEGTIFDETKLYIGQEIDNVYVLSKFMAERNILEQVINSNLDAVIIRVGNLMGRASDGMFQQNIFENAFVNRIRTLINLNIIPDNIKNIPLEFTPIDLTAKAILKLITSKNNRVIYHVYNNNHTDIETVKKVLETMGYNLNYISKQQMTNLIKQLMQDDIKQHRLSGIIQDLDENKELDYSSNVKVACEKTIKDLKKLDFNWNIIDELYLNKFFNYLRNKNFFKGE